MPHERACRSTPDRHLRLASSPRNPALQLARALQTKKVRRERRLLVAEGEDLVDAALARGIRPVAMLFDADRLDDDDPRVRATAGLAERYLVPPKLMAHASGLAASPRVIAVLPQPPSRSFRDVAFPPRVGVYLAGVADPGNVGTLLRTSAALGADWLALGPGSADAFHPRAVRAAMGSTFALPVLEGVAAADLATREGFAILAAVPRGGVAPWDADLTVPLVLALGAERSGLGLALDELSAGHEVVRVTIPQAEGAESLNVSAAGAALLSEVLRQRAGGSGSLTGR
ncbi:TrmH family RNA methyltransferase [Miltoncostaea oceani]|uniref:TrmH family RNA methyltransferase n=1 Tax=Miltoncostaea oceani TaxID=2843216 RepID=UPI001C3C56CB|nr:RNA methyltransferase [Miltoncostaea oceani]